MEQKFLICAKKNGVWRELPEVNLGQLNEMIDNKFENGYSSVACLESVSNKYDIYKLKNGRWVHSSTGHFSGKSFISVCESSESFNENELLKDFLDRLYRTNIEKQLKESGDKEINESNEVGLFWVDTKDGNKVYGDGVSIRDGETFGLGTANQFVVHPSDHYSLWSSMQKANKNWANVRDYETIPRGRVIFACVPDNRHFVVYASPLTDNEECRSHIRSFFGLPGNTEFRYDDEHYQPVEG